MIYITPSIIESIDEFKRVLNDYQAGKIDDLKPYTSIMGIYKEGPKRETYMIRPRIAGGVINVDQLGNISKIVQKYNLQFRFTTRQDIQLHHAKLEDLRAILDDLLFFGLITKGAGGDGVRNIACSPLAGVDAEEAFDVTPYAKLAINYLMQKKESFTLPRKYKIAFSNSTKDTANATITDIGFIAKIQNNRRGFSVYGGGGMGRNAKAGILIASFIEADQALYYIEALKNIFYREGDRKNRSKARLRYVVERLGKDTFLNMITDEIKVLKESSEDLTMQLDKTEALEPTKFLNKIRENALWDERLKEVVFSQKQPGKYSLYVHPSKAVMRGDQLDEIVSFLRGLSEPASLRLTMTQGFFVRDLCKENVEKLMAISSLYTSIYPIENTVACVGPEICNFGLNNSQSLLQHILDTFKGETESIKAALPSVLISGCPNSCGQHPKGLIGFVGSRKRMDEQLVETYVLSMGGIVGEPGARFGDIYGEIQSREIGPFLLELAKLKAASTMKDFIGFLDENKDAVQYLVGKYTV